MKMGIPQVITSDQGIEFKNQLNKELMIVMGIQHRLTTAYHPQAYPSNCLQKICVALTIMDDQPVECQSPNFHFPVIPKLAMLI